MTEPKHGHVSWSPDYVSEKEASEIATKAVTGGLLAERRRRKEAEARAERAESALREVLAEIEEAGRDPSLTVTNVVARVANVLRGYGFERLRRSR